MCPDVGPTGGPAVCPAVGPAVGPTVGPTVCLRVCLCVSLCVSVADKRQNRNQTKDEIETLHSFCLFKHCRTAQGFVTSFSFTALTLTVLLTPNAIPTRSQSIMSHNHDMT